MTLARLWNLARNALALIGLTALACLTWFYGTLWYESQVAPPVVQSSAVSPTAERVAEWITPGVVRFARSAEDDFAREAPTPMARWIFHRAWPYAVKAIPTGTRIGCEVALDRFGSMTAREMAELIVEHQRFHGREAHWSMLDAARMPMEGRTTLFP